MRITKATTRLIKELLGGRGAFNLFGTSAQARAETIDRIEAAGEPGAVPYLAVYALGADLPLRQRAARAAAALLAALPPEQLFLLDQDVRRMYQDDTDAFLAWANLKAGGLSVLQDLPDGGGALLGICSFHRDGHVREAALELLARRAGGAELPFLLIRLNDWVPGLRATARQAVRARLIPSYATAFGANISLVERLIAWKRADHSSVLEWIVEYLRKPECRKAVDDLLAAPEMRTRRLLFRLLARPGRDGFVELLQRALRDQDPTIRLWAITRARKHLTDEQVASVARVGIDDGYSRVRVQAAYIYAEQLPDESAPILRKALMDAAPTLRAIGRYYLGRIEPVDFRDYYRSRLGSGHPREKAIAIGGLGDVGEAADADYLLPYATDTHDKVRAAAFQALARLDGDRFVELFAHAVLDEVPAIAKVAAKALSKRMAMVDLEVFWQEVWRPHPAAKQGRILALLFNASKWDSLYFVLALLSHPDPKVVEMARYRRRYWMQDVNRSGREPTKAQRARIEDALDKHADLMESSAAAGIRFLFSS